MQHQSFPVHSMSWGANWEEMDRPTRRINFCVVPKILLEEIVEAGAFKRSVIKELQRSAVKEVSLTWILRRHAESLTRVHLAIRTAIEVSIEEDRRLLMATLERARRDLGENLLGLVISHGSHENEIVKFKYVSDRSWQRREYLVKKNRVLGNLSRRYASAEHPAPLGEARP